MRIAKFTAAAIISLLTYWDVVSGQMSLKYGNVITAADNPRQFWIAIAFRIVFSMVMFIFAFSKEERK